MSAEFHLEIVTPTAILLSAPVERFSAATPEGYFEVLPRHTPFLAALRNCRMKVTQGGTTRRFATSGGFAEVYGDRVTVLVETAEPADAIDVVRAQQAAERAQQRLRYPSPEIDLARARAALVRARTRLDVAGARP